jgi:hypothetical protein
MSVVIPQVTAWLAQVGVVRDTIVTIAADRSWTEAVIATSQLIVSLAVLGLLVALVLALFALRKGVRELTQLLHSSYGELSAAAHSVRNVADDVKGISGALREDVEDFGATVRAVNTGVRTVLEGAEDRLQRLGALVDVAQEEAEDFVVASVSTMRGLRLGASTLRRSLSFAGRNGLFRSGKRRRPRRRFREETDGDGRRDERPRIRSRVRQQR